MNWLKQLAKDCPPEDYKALLNNLDRGEIIMSNDTRYRIEYLATQNVPDGEDYNPDTHDHYESDLYTNKAEAIKDCKQAVKKSGLGWGKVYREYQLFFGDDDGFPVYDWEIDECVWES